LHLDGIVIGQANEVTHFLIARHLLRERPELEKELGEGGEESREGRGSDKESSYETGVAWGKPLPKSVEERDVTNGT